MANLNHRRSVLYVESGGRPPTSTACQRLALLTMRRALSFPFVRTEFASPTDDVVMVTCDIDIISRWRMRSSTAALEVTSRRDNRWAAPASNGGATARTSFLWRLRDQPTEYFSWQWYRSPRGSHCIKSCTAFNNVCILLCTIIACGRLAQTHTGVVKGFTRCIDVFLYRRCLQHAKPVFEIRRLWLSK